MEFYNTKYVCSYNDSDVFFESELEIFVSVFILSWKFFQHKLNYALSY